MMDMEYLAQFSNFWTKYGHLELRTRSFSCLYDAYKQMNCDYKGQIQSNIWKCMVHCWNDVASLCLFIYSWHAIPPYCCLISIYGGQYYSKILWHSLQHKLHTYTPAMNRLYVRLVTWYQIPLTEYQKSPTEDRMVTFKIKKHLHIIVNKS